MMENLIIQRKILGHLLEFVMIISEISDIELVNILDSLTPYNQRLAKLFNLKAILNAA